MSVVRPYRGVSADQRRADRRERLVAACLVLVGRGGIGAATVDAVCAEAGLTKRYFYEGFSHRDELLAAVLSECLFTALHEDIVAALAARPDAGLAQRSRITIDRLLVAMDDPGIARLYVEAPGYPALQPLLRAAYDTYAELWNHHVLRLVDPSAREHLAAVVFVSGTTQAVINWLDGAVRLERRELVEELAGLGASDPPASPRAAG